MKRLALITLSLVFLMAGFLLESIPGFAQSAPRTRNNLDSGLLIQQEGTQEQPVQATPSATRTQTKNNVQRNSISKSGKTKQ